MGNRHKWLSYYGAYHSGISGSSRYMDGKVEPDYVPQQRALLSTTHVP